MDESATHLRELSLKHNKEDEKNRYSIEVQEENYDKF